MSGSSGNRGGHLTRCDNFFFTESHFGVGRGSRRRFISKSRIRQPSLQISQSEEFCTPCFGCCGMFSRVGAAGRRHQNISWVFDVFLALWGSEPSLYGVLWGPAAPWKQFPNSKRRMEKSEKNGCSDLCCTQAQMHLLAFCLDCLEWESNKNCIGGTIKSSNE